MGGRMKRYKVYFYEWDMVNGKYVERDYGGEEIRAKDINEVYRILGRFLKNLVKDARRRGWDCEETATGEIICVKGYYERLIGYDVEEVGD